VETTIRQKRYRFVVYAAVLSLALLSLFFISVMIGSVWFSPETVLGVFFGTEGSSTITSIIMGYRVPRVLFALFTGLVLGISGGVMQPLTRTPLAAPYLTGLASGAALGAAVAFVMPGIPLYAIPIFAFAGGILMLMLVMFISRKAGSGPLNFILAGLAVGTVASAFLMIIITSASNASHGILYWLYGSFSTSSWSDLWTAAVIATPFLIFMLLKSRDLNILIFGEDHAKQLGINSHRLWVALLLSLSIAVSACVAFCGVIGFIGLVAPHIMRLLVGSDNRFVLPLSGMMGAILLIVSDDIVRSPLNPLFEMPVGSMTALIGVPFFIYLLIKRGKNFDL